MLGDSAAEVVLLLLLLVIGNYNVRPFSVVRFYNVRAKFCENRLNL
jgi:hypothetical protein